ncbi:CotH kinase family protein, partial [Myxococcota bacterium]
EKVAMRIRGTKSRGSNPVAGFKLVFVNEEWLPRAESRRFADLNRLEALSNENDPSNMLQCLSYKLVRDFGVEAPRCNHLRVFVNGELYALMQSVERPKDGRYLEHHFGTNDGPLYGASVSCGWRDSLADLAYKGDTFTGEYTETYDILRGTPEDAEANLIPMLKCGDPETTPDDEEFRACISEWIDVEQWLRLIAAESLMPSVEDFVGTRRNYFLYFLPDASAPHGGIMRVWGYDYDTSLHRQACYPASCDPFKSVAGWYGPRGRRPTLVTRLTTVFRDQYCSLMRSFLSDVYDPQKVDEMANVIEPAMLDDALLDADEWRAAVATMRDYMGQHKSEMEELIDQGCN